MFKTDITQGNVTFDVTHERNCTSGKPQIFIYTGASLIYSLAYL